MGNALVGRLLYSLLRRDVEILTDTSLEKIVRDGSGRVTSAVLVSGGVTRDIGIDGGLILAGGGFNRHAGRRPAALGTDAEWSVGCAGFERRRAGQGASRSAPASATAISAPPSGRRRRSGAGATARRRCFRTSCSTAASRARWWSTATAAASSTKRSPTISSRWRCWRMASPAIPAFLIADARGVAEIRSRHGASRRLGHARRPGRRIPGCRRQHRATGATVEDRSRHICARRSTA